MGARRLLRPRAWLAAGLAFVQISSAAAWAYDLGLPKDGTAVPGQTSEYIYRNDSEEALIPIYLMGAVAHPGLYHVPSNTDLVSLLTLAGGPATNAQTDNILLKGQGPGASKRRIRFDLDKALKSDEPARVALASNDVVFVTPGKPPITSDILTALGIITGIASLIVTGFVISNNVK